MTFFLDENFPRPTAVHLQGAGHQATHALEHFPPGMADATLFAYAQDRMAIFVTTDRDFFHTIPLAFKEHCGVIVITLRMPNRAGLLRRLDDALSLIGQDGLRNAVWLVTDTRIRARRKG